MSGESNGQKGRLQQVRRTECANSRHQLEQSVSQKTFADSLKLPYPLLSDFPNLQIIRSYGGLNTQWDSTTAQRYFFLIDQQGIVRGKWPGKVDEVFPSEPILKVAKELAEKR